MLTACHWQAWVRITPKSYYVRPLSLKQWVANLQTVATYVRSRAKLSRITANCLAFNSSLLYRRFRKVHLQTQIFLWLHEHSARHFSCRDFINLYTFLLSPCSVTGTCNSMQNCTFPVLQRRELGEAPVYSCIILGTLRCRQLWHALSLYHVRYRHRLRYVLNRWHIFFCM
jgi:hypothetical protein